jgi:hypothetical protein
MTFSTGRTGVFPSLNGFVLTAIEMLLSPDVPNMNNTHVLHDNCYCARSSRAESLYSQALKSGARRATVKHFPNR